MIRAFHSILATGMTTGMAFTNRNQWLMLAGAAATPFLGGLLLKVIA